MRASHLHQLLFAKKMTDDDFPMNNLWAQWQTLALKPVTPDMENILQELMDLAPVATALPSPPGMVRNVVAQQYIGGGGEISNGVYFVWEISYLKIVPNLPHSFWGPKSCGVIRFPVHSTLSGRGRAKFPTLFLRAHAK